MAVEAGDSPVLHAFRSLVSPELSIFQILPQADKVVLVAQPKATESCCPSCGCRTGRVHSQYMRRVADLPWQGRVVEIRLHARRFRCADPQCRQRILRNDCRKRCSRKRDAPPASVRASW
ncbi:MAG: transposase family protein [Mesorhizobium sp.]|nr:MAG: transposase family protein [Mesorhizobium sp.]